MKSFHRFRPNPALPLFVSMVLFTSSMAWPQAADSTRASSPAPAFKTEDLSAYPSKSWLKNGGDLYNRNYSPLKQIDRTNVANLKAVWQTHLDGSGLGAKFSGEAQPIFYDGVIYMATGANDIFAIDVKTGQAVWKHFADLDPTIDTVCCGWKSRGVAIGDGKIFSGQMDGKLLALDQKTGKVVWSIQAERWQEALVITSAPLYYDGMVITGFAGGERGIRGRMKAYDAKDGSLLWTFYTVPGPGEIGHETWPQNTDAWKSGGAPVWQTPAIDPELGLLIFSTGNPGPDIGGQVRKGDNLFSDSIVAIDVKTGKYKWHFQQVHHDIWDYDAPNPVMLFDMRLNGRIRKVAAEAGKTGWVYLLDRTNGKPLIGIDEKPVPQDPSVATAATQPYPRGDAFVPQSVDIAPEGYRMVNHGRIFTPFGNEGSIITPGARGGANWPHSSYDPETNYYFVCASDAPSFLKPNDGNDVTEHQPGARYMGGSFGGQPLGVTGIFAALDMKTNKLVWQQRWKEPCYSGALATAGGVVFAGRGDGRFTAHDTSDGKLLWEYQTGAGVNASPIVFEYEGKTYVAVYSGGNVFAASPRGDSLFLFSLKGTEGPRPPYSAPRPAANTDH